MTETSRSGTNGLTEDQRHAALGRFQTLLPYLKAGVSLARIAQEEKQIQRLPNCWAAEHRWENGYIESFHSRPRDEFLERVEFEDVADARAKASWYRREYNAVRPYSSLGYATPNEFSAACDQRGTNHRTNVCGNTRISLIAEDSHFKWTKKRGAACNNSVSEEWNSAPSELPRHGIPTMQLRGFRNPLSLASACPRVMAALTRRSGRSDTEERSR